MTPPLLKEDSFTPPKILPLEKGDVDTVDRGIRQRDLNCRTTGKPILSDKIFYHDGVESFLFDAR